MKTFTSTNGLFSYEVKTVKCGSATEFKLRSIDEDSALYASDKDFESDIFMDLGYYEAKGLNESGFTAEQVNEMLK